MSDWTSLDLRGLRNWDPDYLLLASFSWPRAWPVQPMSNLTITLVPSAEARAGTPVIGVTGFDRVTGALKKRSRKYQGLAYQVGEGQYGVRPGDILVPPSDGPVVFVNPDLVGSLISARFLALRPVDVPGHWLWAVLNSLSGRTIRRRLTGFAKGNAAVRVALREIAIPLPTRMQVIERLPLFEALEESTRGQEDEATSSWWTTVNLAQVQWHHALATPRPERLLSGEPLASYCDFIRRGDNLNRHIVTEPGPDLLPVISGRALAGRPTRDFVPVERVRVNAEAGDVLVGVIGERANARVAEQSWAVASTVYQLRPLVPELGPKLARFLNSTEGLARRRLANRSEYIPQINLRELRQMRVPEGALEDESAPPSAGALAQQLEERLWWN